MGEHPTVDFQPGEFAKLAFAIFFASYLADNRQLIAGGDVEDVGSLPVSEPRAFLPVLAAWAFAVLVMVAQRDLGSSLLFFTLFVVMLWVSTERVIYLFLGGGGCSSARRSCRGGLFDHVKLRVDIWLDPWGDWQDDGFQIVQALWGLSDGGLMGTGLGRGSPDIVPVAESDFMFAAIGEELGLFGAVAVLLPYLVLVGAGVRAALRTDNGFGKLLAAGLATMIGIQAFIIVAGVIRLVPLTGITLPFVCYGGSSLVSNYIMLALLIRLSDSTSPAPP